MANCPLVYDSRFITYPFVYFPEGSQTYPVIDTHKKGGIYYSVVNHATDHAPGGHTPQTLVPLGGLRFTRSVRLPCSHATIAVPLD